MPSELLTYLEINRIAERACNLDTSQYVACEWAIHEALLLVANRAATAVDWPEEPTPEMLTAAWNAENPGMSPDWYRSIYKAMRAASLAAEKEKGRG